VDLNTTKSGREPPRNEYKQQQKLEKTNQAHKGGETCGREEKSNFFDLRKEHK
jgi:hypothetical protein